MSDVSSGDNLNLSDCSFSDAENATAPSSSPLGVKRSRKEEKQPENSKEGATKTDGDTKDEVQEEDDGSSSDSSGEVSFSSDESDVITGSDDDEDSEDD